MKLQFFLSILLFLIISISFGQEDDFKENISEYVKTVQKENEIPGLSLCIVKDDGIIYKSHSGFASIEHEVPIKETSIYRVYSLTKTVISVGVFQLIEQGKLSLEDKILTHISGLPTAWNTVQIKHLLTHSSGLPDMRVFGTAETINEAQAKKLVFEQKMTFKLGERYSYNQTNFWLLHRIIEKVTGKTLSDFIIDNQFEGERKNVFFSSDSKQIVKNRVTSYFPFSTGKMIIDLPTLEGDYMYAANGLNITLNEFVKWDKRLKDNKLLKEETMVEMWKTFPYTKSNKMFTYAWDKIMLNNHESYGFTGSLITAYRIFPKDNLSIFLLSNGLGKIYDIDTIVNSIATMVNRDIFDVHELAYKSFKPIVMNENYNIIKSKYLELKKSSNHQEIDFEDLLNSLGYELLNSQKKEKAVKLFKLNTQEFPNSANTYDSLGEAYFTLKKYDLALKNYKKAITLGGTNGNAEEMLHKIKAIKNK